MVMYLGQGGHAEYHPKKDIGQDDGMSDVTITPVKPVCKLTGGDGNVYAIIGSVKACLQHAGQQNKAEEFARLPNCSSAWGCWPRWWVPGGSTRCAASESSGRIECAGRSVVRR